MDQIVELLRELIHAVRRARSPWMHSRDAAAYAHMKESRMRELIATGEIESHKVSAVRGVIVHESDVDAYLRTLPSGAIVSPRLRAS